VENPLDFLVLGIYDFPPPYSKLVWIIDIEYLDTALESLLRKTRVAKRPRLAQPVAQLYWLKTQLQWLLPSKTRP